MQSSQAGLNSRRNSYEPRDTWWSMEKL